MAGDVLQPTPSGQRGLRGAGFPLVPLPEAVELIARAAAHGRKHSLEAMAAYAGHATANSGPFRQKLAALRDWRFITTGHDMVVLTDAGMQVALPASTESLLDGLLAAFQGCAIFWAVYQEAAKGVPLYPSSIGNVAVTAHGVSARAKEAFVRSFIGSANAVGLADKLPGGEVRLHTMQAGEAPPSEPATAPIPEPAPAAEGAPVPTHTQPTLSHPGIHQVWQDGQVAITLDIRSGQPLSPTAFMQVGAIVTAIETLREILQSGD
jgi:hypothetical protein